MERDDLVQAMASTPTVLARLVRGLGDAELRAGHGPDNWSIKEVLFHLRDVDEVFLGRFERMLAEHEPDLEAFDQQAYARDAGTPARGRAYQDGDAGQALADFTAFRARLVELLRGADLGRSARHPEVGRITVGGWAEHLVAHDLQHLAQIAAA